MGSTSSPPVVLPGGGVLGDQRPRLFCRPPGEVSFASGAEAVELAAQAGLLLDDWEAWWLTQTLGERPDGIWASFENSLTAQRQNGKGAPVEARELAGLFLFAEELPLAEQGDVLLIHTAHQYKTALESFRRILRRIESHPDFDRRVKRVSRSHGEEGIELLTGQRLLYFARSENSGRGFSGDLVTYDEDQDLAASDVGATLPSLSARRNPQVYYTGTAGTRRSTQKARIRRRLVAGADGSLCAAEWSIDPHTEYCPPKCTAHDEPGDVRSYARANPALNVPRYRIVHAPGGCACGGDRQVCCAGERMPAGVGLTVEACERERAALTPDEFARERLGVGIYPVPADGWAVIPRKWWEATMTREPLRPARRAFAVDATPHREFTSIAVAGGLPDDRVFAELAEHRPGASWVVARAAELDRRWDPLCWVVDKRGGAGVLIEPLERAGLSVVVIDATEVGHAFGLFYDACRDDLIRHADDREVDIALAGAAERRIGDQRAWDRQNSSVDISPLVAETFAHWGYVTRAGQGDYDATQSVHLDAMEIARLYGLGVYGPADIGRLWSAGILDDAGLTVLAARGVPVPAGLT